MSKSNEKVSDVVSFSPFSLVKRVYNKFAPDTGIEVHDARGHEVPDPTPVAAAVGFRPGPTLREQIREMVQSERLRQEAIAAGFETLEEADDFDIDDDPFPASDHELDSNLPTVRELRRRKEEDEAKAKKPAPPPSPPEPQAGTDEAV